MKGTLYRKLTKYRNKLVVLSLYIIRVLTVLQVYGMQINSDQVKRGFRFNLNRLECRYLSVCNIVTAKLFDRSSLNSTKSGIRLSKDYLTSHPFQDGGCSIDRLQQGYCIQAIWLIPFQLKEYRCDKSWSPTTHAQPFVWLWSSC